MAILCYRNLSSRRDRRR